MIGGADINQQPSNFAHGDNLVWLNNMANGGAPSQGGIVLDSTNPAHQDLMHLTLSNQNSNASATGQLPY